MFGRALTSSPSVVHLSMRDSFHWRGWWNHFRLLILHNSHSSLKLIFISFSAAKASFPTAREGENAKQKSTLLTRVGNKSKLHRHCDQSRREERRKTIYCFSDALELNLKENLIKIEEFLFYFLITSREDGRSKTAPEINWLKKPLNTLLHRLVLVGYVFAELKATRQKFAS